MARLKLITDRDGLTGPQLEVYDWVVASRGSMIPPYQVLLHTPAMARPAAELGHQIRYEGSLADHDRELAILTTGSHHDCQYQWDSHVGLAAAAGVRPAVIEMLAGAEAVLTSHEDLIVGFVRELCATSTVTDDTYGNAAAVLGTEGVVELATLVGYYTLLAFTMSVAGAC